MQERALKSGKNCSSVISGRRRDEHELFSNRARARFKRSGTTAMAQRALQLVLFIINCFITIITIFTLGIVQAKITKQPLISSALKLTFNGVLASGLAFLIGWGIETGLT